MNELIGAIHSPLNPIGTLNPIFKSRTQKVYQENKNYIIVNSIAELDDKAVEFDFIRFNQICIKNSIEKLTVFYVSLSIDKTIGFSKMFKNGKVIELQIQQNSTNFEYNYYLISKPELESQLSDILPKLIDRFKHSIYTNIKYSYTGNEVRYSGILIKSFEDVKFLGDTMLIVARMCNSLVKVVPVYTIVYLLSGDIDNLGIWIRWINKQFSANLDKDICWDQAWGILHGIYFKYLKNTVSVFRLYPEPKPVIEFNLSNSELELSKLYSRERHRRTTTYESMFDTTNTNNISTYIVT